MIEHMEEQIIQLEGAKNIRDLGGHPTIGGSFTKMGHLYRSDSLHRLSQKDICEIKRLGITMQIDLRSQHEVETAPSKLQNLDWIIYRNISMLDNLYSVDFQNLPTSLGDLYCGLIEKYIKDFRTITQLIISNKGACIFSCTAGKDRTGVLAMLLLSLVNTCEEAIINDYSISAENLAELISKQKDVLAKAGQKVPNHLFSSEPESIKAAISHIKTEYTDTYNYLLKAGLSPTELESLKSVII